MAASTGTDVSSGNTQSAFDKLTSLVLDYARVKHIDNEVYRDGRNVPDRNDLIHGYSTGQDQFGGVYSAAGGVNTKSLVVGGVLILAGIVTLKLLKVI